MPPLGTAPRLVGGQWRTRSGRVLSSAGQRYWSLKKAQGFTDGQGHVSRSSVVAGGRVPGMVTRGNIDIRHRPSVPTPGRPGMHSSVRSITVTDDQGRAHVIPTVIQEGGKWRVASKTEAIAHWRKTGQHLGTFSNEPAANRYASKLHEQQARTTAPRQPQTPRFESAGPEAKKPGFSTIVAAKAGDRAARRQIVAYGRSQRAKRQASAVAEAGLERAGGGIYEDARHSYKTVNPVAGSVIKALSPYTSAKEAVSAARHGKVGPALVAASGILPVGPGRARSLARAVKAGEGATRAAGTVERGRRTLQVGEKVQQLPRARSRITQGTFEHIADTTSRKFPEAPIIGAQARVAKHAGRETGLEAERASARMAGHARALPKHGSPEDVAHFWWAQLPAKARDVESLKQVRAHQAANLERIHNGQALADLNRQKAAITAKLNAGKKPSDPLRAAYAAYRREDNAPDAMDFEEYTRYAGQHKPELIAASNKASEGAAEAEATTSAERYKLLTDLQNTKLRISDLPHAARDAATSVAQLDQTIKAAPKLNPRVIRAVHTLSADRQRILQDAGLLTPERATARKGIVSRWLGHEPSGEEAFIGHRLDMVRSATEPLVPKSPGLGKARLPEGVSRQNKLVRAKTGRVRMSTHVAAEDWRASQNYQQAVRSRDDLAKMGKPFTGVLGKDEMLVNPKGRLIPKEWKTDKLAQLGDNEDAVRKAADEITSGYLADKETAGDLLAQAAEHGVHWNELRVVPKSTVSRYYGQFVPARAASVGGKVYDRAVDATAASIIFGRVGYIPKNIAQNLIMAAPHQGPLLLSNAPRAAQLIPRPGQAEVDRHLWDLLSGEVGTGATGALGKEFTSKLAGVPSKITGAVSGVADTPLRISAFLHEAAAEGVIPRLNPILRDKDKKALLDLLTNPEKRAQLNDIRSRSVEAMADFSRLTPKQRKWARRFLIIPGWLVAGSRYPIHFAATHPIRSGALAYAAAGEPGAPDSLRVNKPLNEYFAKDVPSYVQGVDLGKGKVLRTNSLSPVSTPWDILGAIRGKDGSTVADYANPLAAAAWHIGNQELSGPYGSYRTTQKKALLGNLERLVPSEKFARDLISPPENPRTYPEDTSRLGRLKREVGIFPIRVQGSITGPKKDQAEAETLTRKLGIGKTLPPAVKKSYTRLQERDNAWKDATHGKKAGTRDYYVAKYKADLALARKWGYLNAAQVAKAQEWIGHAPVDDIRRAHSALSDEGGIYDKEFTPARETGRWLEAQDSYLSQLDEAVKRGELTKAQAGRARAWARKAERHDIDKARLALERKLMTAA